MCLCVLYSGKNTHTHTLRSTLWSGGTYDMVYLLTEAENVMDNVYQMNTVHKSERHEKNKK